MIGYSDQVNLRGARGINDLLGIVTLTVHMKVYFEPPVANRPSRHNLLQ